MKLRELHVEHYGVYADRKFQFDPGLQLIYGPNEAGKSTLLQLVRDLLFGIADNSPYAFPEHRGKVAATATLTMQDERSVIFRRRKGRKDTVVGEIAESGETVDESRLSNLLGNAGKELFTHVFGFSQAELALGEKSLEEANLNEALYGGGIGGLANFQQVQHNLRKEHGELFKPTGKKPVINALLTQIRMQAKSLNEASIRPRQYAELLNHRHECDDEVERLRNALDELQRRDRRLDRLEQASVLWTQTIVAKEQLAELPTIEEFPADGLSEFHRLKERQRTVDEELFRLQEQQRETADALVAPEKAPQLIDAEGAVRSLLQDVGRVRGFIEDIPKRKQERDSLQDEIQTRIRELHPEWSLEILDQFASSVAQRETVGQLEHEQQDLQQRARELVKQRTELDARVDVIRRRLAESTESQSADVLDNLIDRFKDCTSRRASLLEIRGEIVAVDSAVIDLTTKLRAALSLTDVRNLQALPIPSHETVREFQSRLNEETQTVRQRSERLQERQAELAERELTLREHDVGKSVVTREELVSRRLERDDAWQRIRGVHIDQQATEESTPSPEEYERQVAEADRLADDRQANAEEVARREQLAAQVERLQQQVSHAETGLREAQQIKVQSESEWRALWKPCDVDPLSPSAMLTWISQHNELTELIERRQELGQKESVLQEAIQKFESELLSGVPTPLNSVDASMSEARRLLEAVRQDEAERKQLKTELPERETRLQEAVQEIAETERRQSDWNKRWRDTLAEMGFPTNWSVKTAQSILVELADLRRKHGQASDLAQRVDDMESEFSEFSKRVSELCERVAPDLIVFPPVDAVVEISERIDAAKEAVRLQEQRAHETAVLQQNLSSRQQQRDEVDEAMTALFRRAGVDTEGDFLAAATVDAQRTKLAGEVDDCAQKIRIIRGNDDEATFLAELQSTDIDTLKQGRIEVQRRIEEIEQSYRVAGQNAGVARHNVAELDVESQSLAIAAELESDRAALSESVDRWATLVLAEHLMQEALQRFQRDHQPRMLSEVSRLLKAMTGGAYVGIERQLDEKGTLLVEHSSGERKLPSALSTGTREQLYLAIRLAYVLHYCQESESLPLVMDDVLVHFDAERARNTLTVIADVSQKVQVLFLTCHEHVVDLFRETIPHCKPLELVPSGVSGQSQPSNATTKAEDRPAKSGKRTDRPHGKPTSAQPGLFPQ